MSNYVWEYKVEKIPWADHHGNLLCGEELEIHLNARGSEGWQLVAINKKWNELIFKQIVFH